MFKPTKVSTRSRSEHSEKRTNKEKGSQIHCWWPALEPDLWPSRAVIIIWDHMRHGPFRFIHKGISFSTALSLFMRTFTIKKSIVSIGTRTRFKNSCVVSTACKVSYTIVKCWENTKKSAHTIDNRETYLSWCEELKNLCKGSGTTCLYNTSLYKWFYNTFKSHVHLLSWISAAVQQISPHC